LTLLALFIGACALAHAEEAEQIVPLVLEDVPEQQDAIEKRGVATYAQLKTDDCWYKCGNKGGSCPSFCGKGGFCCHKGKDDCPAEMAVVSPKHHTCVGPVEPPRAYDSLGCYVDDIWRVLKKYHGDFTNPATAIDECAKKAKFAGHNIFGVAYGKQCFSDATASVNNAKKTYARLGLSTGCSDGRGGFWRINVYKLRTANSVSYAKLGCYNDDLWRVIKGAYEIMNKDNVIGQCARKAQLAGNMIFGVEAGEYCFTDGKASESHKQTTYARKGKTTGCTNGKGGPWKIDVYKVLGTDAAYNNLGCYKDDLFRVIKGPHSIFNPETAVQQCANRALAEGNTIFGVESNEWCFTHSNAANTYTRLGKTTGCENGRGHGWKMNVYSVSEGLPPKEKKSRI